MTLLQMTYMAAALIGITVILRALLLNKLPKQGFMTLWYISLARLLIPFSVPSAMSVYTVAQNVAAQSGQVYEMSRAGEMVVGDFPPQIYDISISPAGEMQSIPATFTLPTEIIVWLIGAAALALFFIIIHLRWRKKYKISLPVQHDFITRWQAEHPLRRRVDIRQCEAISAPLTYGLFHPVVLLPKTIDYADRHKLSYILSHEYAHIRRLDALTKPLLAVALCLHWFNPLVWVMYILANRDMELLCDESAVREYGLEQKSGYALTLIGMEEAKGADPLCNCFNKSAIKERITAIMKMKKTPVIAIIIATIIIFTVTVAFATSGKVEEEINEAESFYSEEATRQRIIDGAKAAAAATNSEDAFSFTDAGRTEKLLSPYLALGLEYDKEALRNGKLSMSYAGKEVRSVYDYLMDVFIYDELNPDEYSDDAIDLFVIYDTEKRVGLQTTPLSNNAYYYDIEKTGDGAIKPISSETDVRSLLELNTADYKKQSVADFNKKLRDWTNSDLARNSRVMNDIMARSFPIELSAEEETFLVKTCLYSNWENDVEQYGLTEARPINSFFMIDSESKVTVPFGYFIKDNNQLSIMSRDLKVEAFTNNLKEYWNSNTLEEFEDMGRNICWAQMSQIAMRSSDAEMYFLMVDWL